MPSTPEPERDPKTTSLSFALAPATLLAGVAGGIAFPILPVVGLRLGLSLPFIGVILAANRAMRVVSSPVVGIVADRVGGRRTLLAGLALQIVVMGLYAIGIITRHAGAFFLIGRLLHGPGSACVFVSAQALALHGGGAKHGGRLAGVVRASIVLGVPMGLFVGGLLSDAVGDAATFGVASVAVAVSLIVASVLVPDLRADVAKRPPLMETLRAMRDRRLLAVGALNVVLSFSAGGMILTTLAILVHERTISVFGRSEQGTAGLLMGLMMVVDASTTSLAGRVGDRWHAHGWVAAFALAVMAPGLVCVGLASGAPGLALGLALIGLGTSGLGPSLLVLMARAVPAERRATGAGLLQLCGDVGGMLGPLVGTALLTGSTELPYLGTAGLVLACVPLAVWLARRERQTVG